MRHRSAAAIMALLLAVAVLLPAPAVSAAESAGAVYRFTGNRELSQEELTAAAADELEAFERQGWRLIDLDDAAYRMELAYRQAGFAFAAVDYRPLAEGHGAAFMIDEGPRVRVEAVTIERNTAFGDQELIGLLGIEAADLAAGRGEGPLFRESAIRDGINAIRDRYYAEGYRDVSVSEPQFHFSPERDRVRIVVAISEGVRQLIDAIELPATDSACVAGEFKTVAEGVVGGPLLRRRQLLVKSRVAAAYAECGYPQAAVTVEEKQGAEPGAVILRVAAKSGPQVRIGAIDVRGNERTGKPFIRQRLTLAVGDLYRESGRRQSFRNLYRTGLFSTVSIELEDPDEEGRAVLVVEVEEAASKEVFVEAGWGSYELLRGRVGYEDRNLFGAGRHLRLTGSGSFRAAGIEAGITDPWLLGSEITADLPIYYRYREEPSFTREESGGSILLSRQVAEQTTATLGYLYRRSSISAIEADIALEGIESGYQTASVTLQLTRDTRNDFFFPSSGQKLYGSAEVADSILGSTLAFYRLTAGIRRFVPLTPALIVAMRYDTGLILPGRHQVGIPLGERFFNGGESTVRSFKEDRLGPKDLAGNPVGGMGYNVLSVELRHRFTDHVAASIFWDYGNLSPNRSRREAGKSAYDDRNEVINDTLADFFNDFRSALGVGVQYLLPIGPARLDVAWNPEQRAERHEESVVVHFSIGMAF